MFGMFVWSYSEPISNLYDKPFQTYFSKGITYQVAFGDLVFQHRMLKAILRLYKALYDQSYLGSKTTMTSGEWLCLISFAWAPLTCSTRVGIEKFKMKIYFSSGIRTHAMRHHDSNSALKTSRPRYLDDDMGFYVLQDN